MKGTFRALWDDCPAVTRLLCGSFVALSLVMPLVARLVPGAGPGPLVCCLHTVMQQRYAWALLSSVLYRPLESVLSLVTVAVEFYLSLAYLPEREQDLGSCRFMVWMMLTMVAVNLIFLVGMAILNLAVGGSQYWLSCNQGLWTFLLVCLTIRSLGSPREPVAVFSVAYVPSRWYPLVLFSILSLLSGGVLWDAAAALTVGYAHASLKLEQMLPSPSRAAWLERTCLGRFFRHCLGCGNSWVPALESLGYEDLNSAGRRYATLSDLRSAGVQRAAGNSSELPLFRGNSGAGAAPAAAVPISASSVRVIAMSSQHQGWSA